MLLEDIQKVVDIIFNKMSSSLVEGKRIEIRGFGTFSTRVRKARKARNPKTNESIDLEERIVLYFRAGKELNERLNATGENNE